MQIKTIKQLEAVVKLMKKEKVDILEVDGLKLVITRHEYAQPEAKSSKKEEKSRQEIEDELLFGHEKY